MTLVFFIAAAVALVSTALTVTQRHAVHALLYFIVSLFAVAVVFFALGAPFAAALEVIVYAGAIMVLFLFVVMMLNPGVSVAKRRLLPPGVWLIPALLSVVLAAEMIWAVTSGALTGTAHPSAATTPAQVGALLFGPYVLGAELAGMLLLAGLVAAAHLGRQRLAGARPAPPPEPARDESPPRPTPEPNRYPEPGELPPEPLPEPPGELPGEPPGTPPDDPGQPPEARA
jgi:NADH-quinone oxidoreductase subunit J